MTFILRQIEVDIDFASGQSLTVSGHRVTASLTKTYGPSVGSARIRIYGLTPTLLNQIASLNQATAAMQSNRLTLKAGDSESGLAIAFRGQIYMAQSDLSQQPDTALNLIAMGGGYQAVQNIPPSSYPAGASAATVMQNLAALGNLDFENSGVTTTLPKSYFVGSVKQQIDEVARHAGINRAIDDGVLAIWPKGSVRAGQMPLVSADTGLVGYPGYASMADGGGIAVTSIFNPQLRIGGAVQVKSGLNVANGKWGVFQLIHEIESEIPGGQWFSHFNGLAYG